jgi:hypothetical protein
MPNQRRTVEHLLRFHYETRPHYIAELEEMSFLFLFPCNPVVERELGGLHLAPRRWWGNVVPCAVSAPLIIDVTERRKSVKGEPCRVKVGGFEGINTASEEQLLEIYCMSVFTLFAVTSHSFTHA